jgi:hypothetical protein
VNKHRTERSSERRPLRIPVKSADVLSSLREGGSDIQYSVRRKGKKERNERKERKEE